MHTLNMSTVRKYVYVDGYRFRKHRQIQNVEIKDIKNVLTWGSDWALV